MRRLWFLLLIGVLMVVNGNGLGPQPALASELTVLPNGLQVLIEQDQRFPLLAMRLYVHAGSAYEQPQEAGISHVLEHMAFKGTDTRGPGEIAEEIEGVGGSLNAATSFDQTVYKLDLPAEHWELGLEVLRDMAFEVQIDPKELAREKAVIMAELRRNEDNPGRCLFQGLQSLIWPETPYARPIIGFRKTVKGITAKDIEAYMDRLYQPQSMLLVVCGQVDSQGLLDKVKDLFGGAQNRDCLTPSQTWSCRGQGPAVSIAHGPWRKVYLSVGLPVPGLRSALVPGLEVLAYLLGGDDTSLLYKRFKYDKQLVDDIAVAPVLLERSGMLYIRAQLDPDQLEQFWTQLIRTLSRLTVEHFSERDLSRARLNLEDDLFQSKETLAGLASKLGYFQFYGRGEGQEQDYLFKLRHVGKGQLQGLIDSYLQEPRLKAHVLLPEEVPIQGQTLESLLSEYWAKDQDKATGSGQRAQDMPDRRQVIDYGQGRKLVLLPDQTLPYTSLTIGWPGGDQLAQEGQSGLAALTARALTRGTKDYQASELQEFLADRASAIGAHAGRQAFSVQAEFPTRFTGDVLGLLGQIINEPTWRKQELDRARDDQQALIVERQDRPLGLISREMFPFLFQSFPFNTYHLGTKEGLQDYHAAQTKSFWARQSAQPWVMAVCGQFDAQRIRKFARNLASSPVQKAQSADSGLKWGRKHELGLVLEDRNQTHLLVVFPVPGIEGQDNAGLSLLRQVLAGQGGLLFRELRDKRGLGYSVTSLLWQISQGGVLGFYIGIDPDKRDQALAGFKAILQDLRDQALPESELRRAKNMLRGNYYRSHQSLGSRSNEAADLLVRGLDLDFRRRLIDQAQDVTAKGLQDIVGKYLNWDRAYTITLSPQ